jgi:2-hydroxychromene-2-carboxylate isomerase
MAKAGPLKADWYFDLISPFSYLQLHSFDRLGIGLDLTLKPVLLGAILKHWGLVGPAEIAPKRLHTYRMVQWTAAGRGLSFRMPARHPFNPLKALRLLAAIGPDVESVRKAFDFVFVEGRAPDTDEELAAFIAALGLAAETRSYADDPAAKDRLRANTEEAIANGVFGVPTVRVAGENFWGDDATEMLAAFLADRDLFSSGEMARLASLPVGIARQVGSPAIQPSERQA